MILDDKTKNEIVTKISSNFAVEKIYLFGSYAYGSPDKNSDLDLSIILKENSVFKSWKDRQDYLLKIRKSLSDLNKRYPIDLLVYSNDEWNKFLSTDAFTNNEIYKKGLAIYG